MNMSGWCPIISTRASDGECLSKCTTNDCAWWDTAKNCCIVFAIHEGIQKITVNEKYDLQDIYNKIPD